MESFTNGFISSLIQIMAIGMQGTWILQCGIKKQSIFKVIAICFICDVILISFGIFGFSSFIKSELVIRILRMLGVAFLIYYATSSIKSAIFKSKTISNQEISGKNIFYKTIAVSLLNPHAWIDTMLIIGGLSMEYTGINKTIFFLGSILASMTWFLSLGYFSSKLSNLLQKSSTLKTIDFLIGIGMFYIAYQMMY